MTAKTDVRTPGALAWILLTCGIAGFAASFILTLDKMKLLQNPHYVPACNLNPIISCGMVMKRSQASVFGFANSLLGVAGFAILAFLGLSLLAGAVYQKWFWRTALVALTFGLAFVGWLIFQSLYRIHSLCPYCMVVWAVIIAAFWSVLLFNLRQGYFGPAKGNVSGFVLQHPLGILVGWYVLLAGFILQHFWYFFNPFK